MRRILPAMRYTFTILIVLLPSCSGTPSATAQTDGGMIMSDGESVNPIACVAPVGFCERAPEDICVSRETGSPVLLIGDCVRAAYTAAVLDLENPVDAGSPMVSYERFRQCDLMPPCGTCGNNRRMWLYRNMQQQAMFFIQSGGRCSMWWRDGGVPTDGLMLR